MHAAVLTTLPSTAARAYTLNVGGSDLNIEGVAADGYMVPIESISVTEEGPGGISSMDFDLYDPSATQVIAENAYVEFWDVTNSIPQFAGFVGSWTYTTGGVGRWIKVRCIGIEVLLDWMVMPNDVVVSSSSDSSPQGEAVQKVIANASGAGISLNVARDSGNQGSQAMPVGFGNAPLTALFGVSNNIAPGGTTVREVIRANISEGPFNTSGDPVVVHNFTIDFRRGMRFWLIAGSLLVDPPYPSDYPTLTIVESGAGNHITSIDHNMDAAGDYVGVYVEGGNAIGSGIVGDGSGRTGPIGSLTNADITIHAEKMAAGLAWLNDHAVALRGSLTIEAWAPTVEYRAGGPIVITNTAAGLAADEFVITSITKTFNKGTTQNWTIAYGGLPPSAMRALRRLTRDKLS